LASVDAAQVPAELGLLHLLLDLQQSRNTCSIIAKHNSLMACPTCKLQVPAALSLLHLLLYLAGDTKAATQAARVSNTGSKSQLTQEQQHKHKSLKGCRLQVPAEFSLLHLSLDL
jgi:hypothetical protein